MSDFQEVMSGRVLSEWIDDNGHMNIAEYVRLFDQASHCLAERIGVPMTPPRELTLVANRLHTIHRRELVLGESWKILSGIITIKREYLTFCHRMLSGSLRCVMYIRAVPFSLTKRRVQELDASTLERCLAWHVPGVRDVFEQEGA